MSGRIVEATASVFIPANSSKDGVLHGGSAGRFQREVGFGPLGSLDSVLMLSSFSFL